MDGRLDLGRAFAYVFDDRSWVSKVLIGGLLSITVVMLPSMFGYLIDLARRVRDGAETPLPEWGEDFGGRWLRGFSVVVIFFIWGLIVMIPFLCISIASGAVAMGGQSDGANAAASLGVAAAYCIMIPLALLLSLAQPAILVHYINRGTFSSGFEVGAIWRLMGRNWGQYLIVFLLFLVTHFIGQLGFALCFIGVIFTLPYAYLVQAHLVGQLARDETVADQAI